MNVSKSTANNMVKKMQEKGWLFYEKYKSIKLTIKAKRLVDLLFRKHKLTEIIFISSNGFWMGRSTRYCIRN